MISTPNEIRAVPTADCWFGSYKQDEGEDFFVIWRRWETKIPVHRPWNPGALILASHRVL